MEFISKLESTVAGWAKNVPHLPAAGQKWLASNVWWIVLIGAIVSGISLLVALGSLFSLIAILGSYAGTYYVSTTATTWAVVSGIVGLVFLALYGILMALAISPLKAGQKKGWNLLFTAWLLNAVSVVINAILTFNVVGFLIAIIFGAVFLAISGYFLFEIHGQFSAARTAKKA